MTDDHLHLEVLASVPSEIEASVIANVLKSQGITAVLTGVNTAMFRAEAPGEVKVMVRREDVDRARQILETRRSGESTTDWDEVDVGEPE